MLFTLNKDNTSGNFYICYVLHVLSMIIRSGAVYKSECLYTIIMYTDSWQYMCVHVYYWVLHVCRLLLYVCQLQYVYIFGC